MQSEEEGAEGAGVGGGAPDETLLSAVRNAMIDIPSDVGLGLAHKAQGGRAQDEGGPGPHP